MTKKPRRTDPASDSQTDEPHDSARGRSATFIAFTRTHAILIPVIGLFLALSLSSSAFLTRLNLLNMAEQGAPLAIIATAGTLVIISGGFDISVGAVYILAGVLSAKITNLTDPATGFLTALATGAGIGTANALVIEVLGVNSLITTLATATLVRGIAELLTNGYIVSVPQAGYATLGTAELLGVKYTIWIAALFTGLTALLLHASVFGRRVFAIGSNQTAAAISGIRVGATRGLTFIISGTAAALAGILVSSSMGSGQPDVGTGLEFSVLTAIVVGGTTISGGYGAVWRTLAGVALLTLIDNGITLLGINPLYVDLVQGTIILTAVSIDAYTRHTRTIPKQ